jgi:hypothetical protein
MSIAKYFAIGFAFYFFTLFLSIAISPSGAFFNGIETSIVIMIGLLKGPTEGLAFGSSNFFVSIAFLFLYGHIYPALILSSMIVAITHAIMDICRLRYIKSV